MRCLLECPECGKENDEENQYCIECGSSLKKDKSHSKTEENSQVSFLLKHGAILLTSGGYFFLYFLLMIGIIVGSFIFYNQGQLESLAELNPDQLEIILRLHVSAVEEGLLEVEELLRFSPYINFPVDKIARNYLFGHYGFIILVLLKMTINFFQKSTSKILVGVILLLSVLFSQHGGLSGFLSYLLAVILMYSLYFTVLKNRLKKI